MESPLDPRSAPSANLWQRWPRALILGMAFLLVVGNLAWQFLLYGAGVGLFPRVLGGAILGVGFPLYIWSRRLGIDRVRDLGLDRPPAVVLIVAALLAVAALGPTSLLAELSLRLHPADPQWAEAMAQSLPETWIQWLVAGLAVAIAAPLVEEILFRGLLHRTFSLMWGAAPGALISALVFAVVHGEPWYVFGLIGVGLLLAFVFEATGSVTACAVAHGAYNSISLVLLARTQAPETQASPLTWEEIVWVALSLVGACLLGWYLWRLKPRPDPDGDPDAQEPF